ncbi:unnamed protein product [Allacma fusca]|uniref:CASC1 C-terminal domain-containing protein n=1 Tax=Allacma fusca TaxID=39272 RepID=A0A8J2LK88_9HEXA|nr:unnamed protein product [Allacma fusca]
MESKKKEKERLERERLEREAAEAIEKQKQYEAEMELRAVQLLESGKIIAFYDKVIFSYHQDHKLLREWAVFTACTNLPDFKLNEINSYMTNWEVNLINPTLQNVFAFSPEILQLIEELKEFLLFPLETVSVETIKQIGMIYHEFKEKQQEYLDRSTYDIIRDLTKYFDPEQGIFDMTESIEAITFSIYGNIFAQPELIGHEYEKLKFKFKIPESIVELRGIYRLLKTEYDHYSDSSNSFFAPGVNNALKRSIEGWEKKKAESRCQRAELHSPEVPEDEKPQTKIEDGSKSTNGSPDKTTENLNRGESTKGSKAPGPGDSDDDNLDSQYRKLAKDLEDLEIMSSPMRGRARKRANRKRDERAVDESSEIEDAEGEGVEGKPIGDEEDAEKSRKKEEDDSKPGEDERDRESKQPGEKDAEDDDGRASTKQEGSGSGSDEETSKSKSASRGRSPEKKEKSKSKSKSTSESRSRSKSKKQSTSDIKKEVKVKKKSKSPEPRQKTEAELAKERERTEKAQFIPKLVKYELNLRNYSILGGVFHFNWIEIPPQPKDRGHWMLHMIEPDQNLEEIIFAADYVPPTQEMQEAKKTPEEMEREAKKQEEELQKLVLLDLKVPRTALWFEPPIPVLWDPVRRFWSTDGFYDIRFNEDQLHLTLRTSKFGIIGLGHNRYFKSKELKQLILFVGILRAATTIKNQHIIYCIQIISRIFSNLPYQSFELKPAGKNRCVFSLMAAMTAIEFTFENELVCVSSLQNVSNSDVVEASVLNKYMRPRHLIKALRYHGLDVFPELDSYAYVDGVLLKHIETEEHMYQCMAVLSPSYNFHWSRWNLLAGRERMVFQMRERLGTTTPGNYQMILNTPAKCSLIACTEVSPNFSEEPIENSQYHADLLHLAMTVASDDAKNVMREASPHFIETVRILVTSVRPVSFS